MTHSPAKNSLFTPLEFYLSFIQMWDAI